MNILVLNQDWFVRDLRAAGHTVFTCGVSPHLDIHVEVPLIHVDTVIKGIPPEQRPELILVLDNSAPALLSGLEETALPIVFYAVDTHHHGMLHHYLAHVFDKTIIAQKDYLSNFSDAGLEVSWMPLWASQYMEPKTQKKHGAVFVGTLNPKLNADRVKFFEKLKTKVDFLCLTGAFPEIFPYSEIVINQTVKRDLNFRVFEAMMSGAMLLTERIENGMPELFRDGEHLVTYEKGNVDEAAGLIKHYLADIPACRRIAQRGREEILARHLEKHRAQIILDAIKNVPKKQSPIKYLAAMCNYTALGRNATTIDASLTGRAFLSALKAAEFAIGRGEQVTEEIACYLVLAAIRYDSSLGGDAGAKLLEKAHEANPQSMLLSLACLRNRLNRGAREQAEELARRLSPHDHYMVFLKAEEAISVLLAENS